MEELEKDFVPYPLALRLKAIGFDKPCIAWYNEDGKFMVLGQENTDFFHTTFPHPSITQAPTFSQAFRWFREKYEIFGVITSEKDDNYYNTEFFGYSVYKTKVNAPLSIGLDLKENASYEEAELTCLDKLIKIVESKVKK